MRELEDRFRTLDRIEPPDLWNEAVSRAAELGATRRQPMSQTFVLVAAALLLALLAGAIAVGARFIWPAPDASSPYTNGMIVGQVECRLLAIDPNSNESRELVPSPEGCSPGEHPPAWNAWSSEGERLVYMVSRMCGACFEDYPQAVLDKQGPWVYETSTGATRQLESCPERYCEGVDISPDGSLVAYSARASTGDRFALVVVGADPGGSSHPIEMPGWPGRPRFSADGSRIAVAVDGAGLYTIDVNGITQLPASEAPRPTLIYDESLAANPSWSPDGAWIAYNGADGGIWLVGSDGSDARELASSVGADGMSSPAWAPDGSQIAYLRTESHGNPAWKLELWTVGIDGGDPMRVYESACCATDWRAPTWSPDGEYIAFGVNLGFGGPGSGTAIIRPDGTDLQWVSTFPTEPDWQPIPIPSATD